MTPPPFRKPSRISVTVPFELYRALIERSNREGRSISNLASFLLETAIKELSEPADASDERAA